MKEILLVEDSEANTESVESGLRLFGVVNPVRRLGDGIQAIAYLVRAEQMAAVGPPVPSVLFLDVRLPGVSGFEILKHLQNRLAFAATLTVLLSELGDLKSVRHGYELGAHSFLTKPVNQSELGDLITWFPTHWLLN